MLVGALLWLLLIVISVTEAWSNDRPNIVVFLVDDMGIMDTSVPFLQDSDGQPKREPLNDFYHTLGMERLARQGVRFNDFHAFNVCSPTRISLHTGQNAARHRTTNWINPAQNNPGTRGPRDWNWAGLTENQVTLPRQLREAGYRTIHIGKAHFGPNNYPGSDPLRLGFDENIGGSAIGHPGSYLGAKSFGAGGTHAVPHLEKYANTDTFLTEALTLEACDAIDRAIVDRKPFFLNFSHYAVHTPFESDQRFASRYVDSGRSAQAQAFATLIEGIDKSLSDLIDHLDAAGVAEETLIFFLGDNGSDAPLGGPHEIASSAPFRGKKGSHYEGGTRTPLIVAWAKPNPQSPLQQKWSIQPDSINSGLATICDLFPTIMDIAKIPSPPEHPVDGVSLTARMAGGPAGNRAREFLVHFPHEHRDNYFTMLKLGEWKIVYHYFGMADASSRKVQLFNLSSDIAESHDLVDREPEKSVEMLRRMQELLDEFQALPPQDEFGNQVKIEIE
jgi:arylsulfatase A-like enzyme